MPEEQWKDSEDTPCENCNGPGPCHALVDGKALCDECFNELVNKLLWEY